jgi:hypothetical protein
MQRKTKAVMPVNNTVNMPYYLKYFVDKGLVNIRIALPRKDEPKRPHQVLLVFDSVVLKKLLKDQYGLAQYSDQNTTSDVDNTLLILNYRQVRKNSQDINEAKQEEELKQLQVYYCKNMKTYLLTTLNKSQDSLIEYNNDFDIEDFRHSCSTTKDVDGFITLSAELNRAISDAVAVRKSKRPVNSPSHSSSVSSLSDNLTIHTQTTHEDKEEKRQTPIPSTAPRKIFSSEVYNDPNDSGMKQDDGEGEGEIKEADSDDDQPRYRPLPYNSSIGSTAPLSPTSPKSPSIGNYTDELIKFIKTCLTEGNIIPDNPRIDLEGLSCSISTLVCKVPVYGGGTLFDIHSLRKLQNYTQSDYFIDPESHTKIYKSALVPAHDIRAKTLEAINEENYFQAFLAKYAEDYAKAGVFKWSNFNSLYKHGKINNFNQLFEYVIKNPGSRSAKVFSNMSETLTNPFKIFIKNYLKDYQTKIFHHSNFLKRVRNKTITDMDAIASYGHDAANTNTRTARLLGKTN